MQDDEQQQDSEDLDPTNVFASKLYMSFELYADQMQALRDVISATEPHASALDDPGTMFAHIASALDEVPHPRRAEVGKFMRESKGKEIPEFMSTLFERFGEEEWGARLFLAFHQAGMRRPRLPLLRNSLLTAAVSSMEAFLAGLVTEFYRYKPDALKMRSQDQEKEFSLRDLQQFNSIDDAVDAAIYRRVDELTFGGLADWKKFFTNTLKIDLEKLTIDWAEFQEVIQRRHVIVHNGGVASRKYIDQMQAINPTLSVSEGDDLSVDQEYLGYAIDQLLVFGALLVVAVSIKLLPSEKVSTIVKLSNLAYELLTKERWSATKKICAFGIELPGPQSRVLTFKVNLALAVKATDGMDAIRAEVTSWDVSALSETYRLARACLLNELDTAFNLLDPLLENGTISARSLLEWPLFSELRKDPRYLLITQEKLQEDGVESLEDNGDDDAEGQL